MAGTDRELRATAAFPADHASRLFEVADIALRGAASALPRVQDLKANLPDVEDVWLSDTAGRLRLTTFAFPTLASNAADRDAFRAQREPSDRRFIGSPIVGRVTNMPTFLLACRLENRTDGGFRGMVSVTTSLAYFGDYWRSLDMPLDARVTLMWAEDQEILAAAPSPEEAQAADHVGFCRALAENPQGGWYEGRVADAQRRGTYQRFGALPLYVRISVSHEAITPAWRGAVLPCALFAGAALATLGLLILVTFRQARREARASADLERRVEERTADLEAAGRRLEREAEQDRLRQAPEDGGDGPPHGRPRARFQQHARRRHLGADAAA